MGMQPSLWTTTLSCLLMAPRKWREGEQEKAEPAFRKSCRSHGLSPESITKNLLRNMESNNVNSRRATPQFPFPCMVMTDFSLGRMEGWFGVQSQATCQNHSAQPSYHSLCSMWFMCFLKTSMAVTYSHSPPNGSSLLVSWQLGRRRCQSFNFSFWILKDHPLKWMCSALSWNHTEWAKVHKKPIFYFPDYENRY